jgi:hypothetical protein
MEIQEGLLADISTYCAFHSFVETAEDGLRWSQSKNCVSIYSQKTLDTDIATAAEPHLGQRRWFTLMLIAFDVLMAWEKKFIKPNVTVTAAVIGSRDVPVCDAPSHSLAIILRGLKTSEAAFQKLNEYRILASMWYQPKRIKST